MNILMLLCCVTLWRNRTDTSELFLGEENHLKIVWMLHYVSELGLWLRQVAVEVTARSKVKFQVDLWEGYEGTKHNSE